MEGEWQTEDLSPFLSYSKAYSTTLTVRKGLPYASYYEVLH